MRESRGRSRRSESFDLSEETDRLSHYYEQLQLQQKKEKTRVAKEQAKALYGPRGTPTNSPGHVRLYEIGKERQSQRRYKDEEQKQYNLRSRSPSPAAATRNKIPVAVNKACNRLYEQGIKHMQEKRDDESMKRNDPSPSLRLSASYSRPNSRPKARPEEVIDRLYSRSIEHQLHGKEKREEVERHISTHSKKPPLKVFDNSWLRIGREKDGSAAKVRKYKSNASSEEVMERLYGRSMEHQQYGKVKREEVEKSIAHQHPKPPMKIS